MWRHHRTPVLYRRHLEPYPRPSSLSIPTARPASHVIEPAVIYAVSRSWICGRVAAWRHHAFPAASPAPAWHHALCGTSRRLPQHPPGIMPWAPLHDKLYPIHIPWRPSGSPVLHPHIGTEPALRSPSSAIRALPSTSPPRTQRGVSSHGRQIWFDPRAHGRDKDERTGT